MEMRKILWPTDLSGRAEKALAYVKALGEKFQTEVHVLYVIEDIAHHEDWYGNFEREHIDKIIEWEEKKARERLDQICTDHLEGCPLYIKHTAVGDPAREILKLIETEKVDTVVMATRGEKGHFRFGGVTEKVAKNSPVPVMMVPVEGESE